VIYRRFILFGIIIVFSNLGFNFGIAQDIIHKPLVENNEIVLLSFVVENSSKIFTIVTAEDNSYIVQRFGEEDNIELEFPTKTEDSWDQFTYSHYSRAVGNANALLDLNYLEFISGDSKYFFYDSFSEEFIKSFVGVTVTNLTNGQEINYLADSQAKIGNLSRLQLSSKVKSQSALKAQVPSTPGRTIEVVGASDNNVALEALEAELQAFQTEIANYVNLANQSLTRVEREFEQLVADTLNAE